MNSSLMHFVLELLTKLMLVSHLFELSWLCELSNTETFQAHLILAVGDMWSGLFKKLDFLIV